MKFARAARLTKPRLAMFAAALAVASAAALTSQAASARTDSSQVSSWAGGTRPVIVLEHGAWADASSWSKVIGLLQQDGFTVYAPPNPLRGVANDSQYLTDFLTQNAALAGRPVVLVGHSYGGFVITNAATGNSNVKALVYVDAFIPDAGDTLGSLTGTGSCLGSNAFNAVPYPNAQNNDVDLYIKQSVVPGCFASGLPPSQAAVIAATQRPLAASTFSQQLTGPPAWKTIPSWAVIGTADKVLPPTQQTSMAKRADAHITDINAGHLSMIADPEAVARVIEQAAQATS
jgi:pimeloyl-ACP methyl ester carboxylesterase